MDQETTPWRTVLRSADRLFRATTHPAAVQLPVEGSLLSLAGVTQWLNSPPLTPAGLRGRVVLVDFWTYTCINWLRTLPYLRAWADKYRDHGLVVLGVHTPEFDVEHDLDNEAWLNLWAHRSGESGTHALAEELRRLPWRVGRD